ncbi:MAG TPA: ATP-binding protein [Hyphomicrobiaceae bacterium]|nr:ATP-binding protein [Hyphomicrobiaceae bacterium]
MESAGQQFRLRIDKLRLRVREAAEPWSRRLAARRRELAWGLALTAFFFVAGGLSLQLALAGIAAALAFALLLPGDDATAGADQRAAGEAGAAAQRLWRLMIDAVPEPAVALNAAARLVHANKLAEEELGGRRGGAHIASMSRDPGLLAAVEEALSTREPQTFELHGRVPVERRLLASIVPLKEAPTTARDVPTLLITFRDLSEQDRLARMRADFVANASHELRTPLAYLKGSVETLQGPAKDDAAARATFLKTMGEQAELMSRLVDDLLSLSRVEMREYLPPSGEADLATVIADVAHTLEPIAQQADIALTLNGLEAAAPVRGDHDELAQVFQNLIQNAIKYGREGGKVDVVLSREAGPPQAHYRVDVSDDGPGIPPQHLPRLTERFYRVNVAASREKGGTGLGLAIVKHILKRHRGELAIASELGEGSTFSVTLPAATAEPPPPQRQK